MNNLVPGTRYVGTVTGVLDGRRIHHEVEFVAARAQVEPLVRDRETTPDQDRVFVQRGSSSYPTLFVAGSIRPAAN